MSQKDSNGLNMEKMLKMISEGKELEDLDIEQKVEELEEEIENEKSIKSKQPQNGKHVKTNSPKTRKSGNKKNAKNQNEDRDDQKWCSTLVPREYIKYVKLMYPDIYLKHGMEIILKEWKSRNRNKLKQLFEKYYEDF